MGASSIVINNEVLAGPIQSQSPSSEPTCALKDINSSDDVEQWQTYYYRFPQPDLTVKAMLVAEKEGLLDRPTAMGPFIATFSQVFAQNPQKLTGWVEQLRPLSQTHKRILWGALKQANTAEAIEQAAIVEKQLSARDQEVLGKSHHPTTPIAQMPVECPLVLDMLWASFFVTGDERYVKRIMTVLPHGQSSPSNRIDLLSVAAQWSLTANARQHKRVLEICRHTRDTQPELKPVMSEIIGKATTAQTQQNSVPKAITQHRG
jgi:hypothetical protein